MTITFLSRAANRRLLLSSAALAACSAAARGQGVPLPPTDYIWTGTASGDWRTANNWSPNGIPAGIDRAIFDATSSATTTATVTGATTVRSILFDGTTTAFTVTLAGPSFTTATGSFTMNADVTAAQAFAGTANFTGSSSLSYSFVNNSTTAGAVMTFGADLTYRSTITPSSSNTLTLGGTNTGSNEFAGAFNNGNIASQLSITKSGVGRWVHSGGGNYSGQTRIQAGTLAVAHDAGLGSTAGDTTVSVGAVLELVGNRTIGAEALTLSGAGLAAAPAGALRGTGGFSSWAGPVTLAGNATVRVDGGSLALTGGVATAGFALTVAGAGDASFSTAGVAGSGRLVKADAGTLTLSAASTYVGGTTVLGGVLALGAADVLPNVGTVILSGGTLSTGAGVSDAIGPLAVTGNGSALALGNAPHTLTAASLDGTGFTYLDVDGWAGTAAGGTRGRVVFVDASGFTADVLSNITFTGYGPGAALIAGGELVPAAVVPEPASVTAVAAAGLVVVRAVRRRRGAVRGRPSPEAGGRSV